MQPLRTGVHIGFGMTPSEMRVSWATYQTMQGPPSRAPKGGDGKGHYGGTCPKAGCGGSYVQWGLSAGALTSSNASGTATAQTYDSGRVWSQHTVSLTGLKPSTKYFYRVGDPATGWSAVTSFRSQVRRALRRHT